jgi:hypothetical protein
MPLLTTGERVALSGLLIFILAVRTIQADQPIVENYVGRQIPTAMVARNLERGSGFFRPELDTAPLPNLFLVEPPLFETAAVGLRRATGWPLERSGRLVSALAMVLGGWGLFGLARRREGARVALLALAAFAVFPVTIRYGRAFQPDALMLGALLAGLRCVDEHRSGGGEAWLIVGGASLATGLALKVVAAYVLVPLIAAIVRPPRVRAIAPALMLLAPALIWYGYAATRLAEGGGSRASADNGAIWLRVLVPTAWLRIETLRSVAWSLLVRGFTPLGLALAVGGFLARPGGDRLWTIWGASALAALAALAGKLHHEYYFLALAPVAAVEVGRALATLEDWSRAAAVAAGGGVLVLALALTGSTWRTPPEWASLPEAARAVRAHVPASDWVVAPEALLFASDRRGCRLEFTRPAARRAAGEWGAGFAIDDPVALIEFYRAHGARFVADVADGVDADPARRALHQAIRRRYNVLLDRPDVLLARLTPSSRFPDGTR